MISVAYHQAELEHSSLLVAKRKEIQDLLCQFAGKNTGEIWDAGQVRITIAAMKSLIKVLEEKEPELDRLESKVVPGS